ncbi:DUF998 domain-containing protein [Streptomyces albicerus]|uniref:DUF998 domain-containing protein n=1 Tax=Streptomyces albicerus TaxID=2569859 RepID=UPI00124B728E|nr:DUF998 domain-containing protein [Streptomyces albicerus]
MTTSRTAVAALLALGALAYTTWVLELVLTTGLAPSRTYVSELAARNQPHGTLFRTTDLVAGVLVGAGGLLALLKLPSRGRRVHVGWAGLALFGAATAVDSRLPLSCTPTVDPVCAARERAGLVTVAHSAHTVSSAVALCGILVGMVALTGARYPACAGSRPRAEAGAGVGTGVSSWPRAGLSSAAWRRVPSAGR